jgi:hypothetical protein
VSVQASFDEVLYGPETGRARVPVRQHLPVGSRQAMQFGIIVWEDPRKRCPPAYSGKGLMPYQHLEAGTLPGTRSTR